MKGIYCILMCLNRRRNIRVAKLGLIPFKKGYYCYVGSALNNLEKRIKRHISKSKKMKWHIDYLLKYAAIIGARIIITSRKLECLMNKRIEEISTETIKTFGSTDCKCTGHLHYFNKNPLSYAVINNLKNLYFQKS